MGETQRAALAETFGSFPHIIAANAAALDSQIAMRDDEGELSWAALGERVERIAARLVADIQRRVSRRPELVDAVSAHLSPEAGARL